MKFLEELVERAFGPETHRHEWMTRAEHVYKFALSNGDTYRVSIKRFEADDVDEDDLSLFE